MLADRKNADRRDSEDSDAESQREVGDFRPSILEATDPKPPCTIWKERIK
jgi:hypothetical protein